MEEANKEEFSVEFTVFDDPVSKERPRTVIKADRYGRKKAHTYTPSKTKKFEETVGWVYKSFYGSEKFDKEVPLKVRVEFFLKPPKRGKKETEKMINGEIRPVTGKDVDNMAKSVLDGLNGVAYKDDSQVVELSVGKFYSNFPRTEIRIERFQGG